VSQSPVPAAQYVRMSTDDQQYSIDNQKSAIQEYARSHGFSVIETYADAGKSGLVLKRRSGLSKLLSDVVSGDAKYQAILVYDVSRWGRFQDVDEAAHYEFVCKSAGIPVHYCAEQFVNDERLPSSIMKALKRTMAGEYSRELSVKVYAGQRQMASLGYKTNGDAPYGMKRVMTSADGRRRILLRPGERKGIKTYRTILVPGASDEIKNIRDMFAMAATGKPLRSIAADLNKRHVRGAKNQLWDYQMVHRVVRNLQYGGWSIWGRSTSRLGTPIRRLPRNEWVTKSDAYVPIIDRSTFDRVQKIIEHRCTRPKKSNEELLVKLKRLLDRKGVLNIKTMAGARGMFHSATYRKHFGTLHRAFELVGYHPPHRWAMSVEHLTATQRLRQSLLQELVRIFPDQLRIVRAPGHRWPFIQVKDGPAVSVYMCRQAWTQLRKKPRWVLRVRPWARENPCLICIVDQPQSVIRSMFVLPPIGNTVNKYLILTEEHAWLTRGRKLVSLHEFLDILEQISAHATS
jgi:DNA invertase Pin-like site-specific DNA recombinase